MIGSFASHGSADLALLDQIPIGLAIFDIDGALRHANPCYTALVGHPRLPSDDPADTPCWTGVSPGGQPLPLPDFPCRRALRGEVVTPGVDLRFTPPGERARWLNISASPIRDPGGAILGTVLLFFEAGDAGQVADAPPSAGLYRLFADQSSTALWIVDADSRRFSYRNAAHHALEADGAGAVLCIDDWLDLVSAPDRARVRRLFDRAIAGRSGSVRYRLRGPEGAPLRLVRETTFLIRDEAGLVRQVGGVTEPLADDEATIYLVGPACLHLVEAPLRRRRAHLRPFPSVADFLAIAEHLAPAAVIVDAACVENGGPTLDELLAIGGDALPTVVVGTPRTRLDAAISAMRGGAVDFLVPPVIEAVLVAALDRADARLTRQRPEGDDPVVPDRLAQLSRREREVLAGLARGGTNKSIGRGLGISPRTVEIHRAKLMSRLDARNLADLLSVARGESLLS